MRRLTVLALLATAACGAVETREQAVSIHPDVYKPYSPEDYPKLYATWGEQMAEGQALRESAAEKVALSPDCDAVELSEISERTPLQVFVDCRNGNRWRLTQADLSKPLDQGENVYGG